MGWFDRRHSFARDGLRGKKRSRENTCRVSDNKAAIESGALADPFVHLRPNKGRERRLRQADYSRGGEANSVVTN